MPSPGPCFDRGRLKCGGASVHENRGGSGGQDRLIKMKDSTEKRKFVPQREVSPVSQIFFCSP